MWEGLEKITSHINLQRKKFPGVSENSKETYLVLPRIPQQGFCILKSNQRLSESLLVVSIPAQELWNQQHEQEEKDESDLFEKCFLLSHIDLWGLSQLWPEKASVHLVIHDTSVSVHRTQSDGTKCTQMTMGLFPVKCHTACAWAFWTYTYIHIHPFGLFTFSTDD